MNQNNPPQPDALAAEKPEAATEQQAMQQPSEKAEAQQETAEAGASKENTTAEKQSTEPQPLAHPAAAPSDKAQ